MDGPQGPAEEIDKVFQDVFSRLTPDLDQGIGACLRLSDAWPIFERRDLLHD
jgi:hypothetical protein